MLRILAIVILLSGCATGTKVELTEEMVDAHNASVENKMERIICTREKEIGSHFSRKVCRTVRQIQAEREEARRTIENVQSVSQGSVEG